MRKRTCRLLANADTLDEAEALRARFRQDPNLVGAVLLKKPDTKQGHHYFQISLQVEVKDDIEHLDFPTPFIDIEKERGRQIQKSLRKKGFTKRQKERIKERDGRCVGNGRYGECDGKQPLALCQADHIDPDGPNAVRNGQTLCGNCHDWKTAVENGWWKP